MTTTVKDIENLRTLAAESGVGHWSVCTDYMPVSTSETHLGREVGCIVIRLSAGRTERFVDHREAADFIRRRGAAR